MTDRRTFLGSSLGAALASAMPAMAKAVPPVSPKKSNELINKTVEFGKQEARHRASTQARSGIESFQPTSEGVGKRPPVSFLPHETTPLRERFGLTGGKL